MSVTERARGYVYWLLDYLKGQPVGKHYREIREASLRGVSPAVIEEKIQNLLRHATETTAYYASFGGMQQLCLTDFPVMNKQLYREHYDAFLSTRYLDAKDNRVMKTSGSTGTPFQIIQNREKILRNTASALVIGRLGGYRLGDRQAFARVWVQGYRKSALRSKLENLFPVDASQLDSYHLAQVGELLVKKRITSIIGYASYLSILSNYLVGVGRKANQYRVKSILSISEHLPSRARTRLKALFGCAVNAQYSNEENGVMGTQEGGEEYYLDSASWHFEILKSDSDEPAPDGQLGRIVITDLYNYAFPMIRYDTGDMAVAKRAVEGKTGRYWLFFLDLYGRRSDVVFDLLDRPVSPRLISTMMHDFATRDSTLLQWQFIQLARRRYCFRIVSRGEFRGDVLRTKFSPLFGEEIQIEQLDEIPVLSSGKRKCIQNDMLWSGEKN